MGERATLAFGSSAFDLLAITAVGGNVPVLKTARNARILRQIAGREDVPVFMGADRPLRREPAGAGEFHGAEGLGDMAPFEPDAPCADGHAADAIIDLVMARPAKSGALAVLGPLTNLALALMFWQWRPMGGVIWEIHSAVGQAAAWSLFALGWLTVLYTTFLINHFDLFGLRQVWLYFRGREYAPLPFVTPGPYRFVRHPLYIGWLLAFWATPTMTAAHLVFALGMTAYILIAIYFEERTLAEDGSVAATSAASSAPVL